MSPVKSAAHVALGAAVRKLRTDEGFSQEELGRMSGLHRNYIGGVERGELNPSYASLKALAKATGVQVSELVALAEALERH